jgi:hypothetical protein
MTLIGVNKWKILTFLHAFENILNARKWTFSTILSNLLQLFSSSQTNKKKKLLKETQELKFFSTFDESRSCLCKKTGNFW